MTIVPESNDVICGSGKAVMNHPGNQLFRALVKANVQHYSDSHSHMKSQITENIVKEIEAKNGRFLKKLSDGTWCILSEADALAKTSQALRDAKRTVVKENKPEDILVPVNHQSLDDPMQSITMSTSLQPILSLDVPLSAGENESGRKQNKGLDNTVDIDMISSMFGSMMSRADMSIADHEFSLTSPCVSVTNINTSTIPDRNDVLSGSGKAVMNHPGNMEFRRMVKTMVTCFSDAPGHMKTQISETIVQNIEACGGRFLKQNTEGVWCPITHAEAVEKTSQALRDAKRLTLRQKSADHTPDSSPKRDRIISAPMPAAPYILPPSSNKNVYNPTVAEVTSSADLAMSSFGPSFDDPSSVVTFDISGNMDSVEILGSVYGSKVFEGFGNGM